MKIIKPDAKKTTLSRKIVSLQLKTELVDKVEGIARDNRISRQKLIEAILEQVLADKSFVLKLPD